MGWVAAWVGTGALALLLAASLRRWADHRADARERRRLLALQAVDPPRFDSTSIAHLPEPARRYLRFAIAEGAPLHTVAEIEMSGRFGLGSRPEPRYLSMNALQTLCVPHGFLWRMSARRGALHLSGSDSGGWTRFWLLGLLPVARVGGSADHTRAAFGRYVAEAVLWTPGALLPGPGVTWHPIDEHRAQVVVQYQGLSQAVDLTVDPRGRPTQVVFARWSNANPERIHRLQPFGCYLSAFQAFEGFRLPTHVEAGNQFGTSEYFPFYIADISTVRFPRS